MLLSLLLTVAAPFSNNSCLLSSALLHVKTYFYCFSSTPPHILERPLVSWASGREGPAAQSEMLPLAQLSALHYQSLSQNVQHLILSPKTCPAAAKLFAASFRVPQQNCLRQGIFYNSLHQFNREISRDFPIKKFNSFFF